MFCCIGCKRTEFLRHYVKRVVLTKLIVLKDYAVLEAEANKIAEQCREQQAFCDQQRGNNGDAQRDNLALAQRLSHTRLAQQQLAEQNATSDSEVRL